MPLRYSVPNPKSQPLPPFTCLTPASDSPILSFGPISLNLGNKSPTNYFPFSLPESDFLFQFCPQKTHSTMCLFIRDFFCVTHSLLSSWFLQSETYSLRTFHLRACLLPFFLHFPGLPFPTKTRNFSCKTQIQRSSHMWWKTEGLQLHHQLCFSFISATPDPKKPPT